jgi:hypothetical protein
MNSDPRSRYFFVTEDPVEGRRRRDARKKTFASNVPEPETREFRYLKDME